MQRVALYIAGNYVALEVEDAGVESTVYLEGWEVEALIQALIEGLNAVKGRFH